MQAINARYNVLWLDDEHESLTQMKLNAKIKGINLIAFKSYKMGSEYLDNNIHQIDAVILDAMFFENETQFKGTESLSALRKTITKLNQVTHSKKLPYFIFSGQQQIKNNNQFIEYFGKVYDKLNPTDIDNLFEEIKREADKSKETQIRHKYKDVFEVCTELYIGIESHKPLFKIFSAIADDKSEFDDEMFFNQIRIIIENLFRSAYKYGFLPEECINKEGKGSVNIYESNNLMAGKDAKYCGYRSVKSIFPEIIANHVSNIIRTTNFASHSENLINDRFSNFRSLVKTPYLLFSLSFQLADVLVWFKNFVDENLSVLGEKQFWQKIEENETIEYIGIIEQDKNHNYHCGKYLLSYKSVNEHSKLGDKIKITHSKENVKTSLNDRYPLFAIKYEIIE